MENTIRRRELLGNVLTGAKAFVPVMFVSRVNGPELIDGNVNGTAKTCEILTGLSPVLSPSFRILPSILKLSAEVKITVAGVVPV